LDLRNPRKKEKKKARGFFPDTDDYWRKIQNMSAKFKYLELKFKYLATKCQNMTVNSNVRDKIQIK